MNNKFNLLSLVRPSVATLQPYSSARDEFKNFDREMIYLDANENPFDTDVNRYPDPQQNALKNRLATLRGVATSQLLLGNGSDEVLDLLFRAFCEPNKDNVITMPPTYGMYKVLAGVNAVMNREVLLTDAFELDVDEILETQDKNSKLLFLCSPNNPTGNCFSEKSILQLLKGFNGLVVIDEAYIDFSENDSWIEKLDDFPNLVVTQTLSKAFGMAGVRLGMCFASKEIISVLNKIKPPYNVNELTQQRALEQLNDTVKIKEEINLIIAEKDILLKQLLQVGFVLETMPSQANFILVRVDDAVKRYQQLLRAGIVVRNRSNLPLCKNTLRFTIGTPTENKRVIKTLKTLEE